MIGLQRWWSQVLAVWGSLSARRRFAFIVLAVLGALAVGVFAYVSSDGDYRVLYANLPVEETGAITARLQSLGVPYRLDAGGTSVLVPEQRLVQARVSLAAEGVAVKGGKGFELFDDAPLGMTPFVQSVNYTRALQAELGRSIMQIEQVAAARVLIARSDPTPFVRDQRPSTASVILKLKLGATLNRSTAASIVALVVRSVEGLRPENVTVVDSSGRLLSDGRTSEADGLTNGTMEYRRELETYLATKAEELLWRHLGPGRAIVRISADMNFQRVKERQEQYSPTDKVIASERLVTSKSGSQAARGGVTGAASNVRPAGGTGGGGSSQEETIQTDYLVSKSVRELEDRMGSVQRLTIAAMVDLSAPGDDAAGAANVSVADVQDLIKQAVGYKNGRDEIKVSDVKLAAALPLTDVDEDAAQLQRVKMYVGLARNLALIVAVAVTVITLALMLWRRRRSAPPASQPALTGVGSGSPDATQAQQRDLDLGRFAELAQRDPNLVANLLETLLGEAA